MYIQYIKAVQCQRRPKEMLFCCADKYHDRSDTISETTEIIPPERGSN